MEILLPFQDTDMYFISATTLFVTFAVCPYVRHNIFSFLSILSEMYNFPNEYCINKIWMALQRVFCKIVYGVYYCITDEHQCAAIMEFCKTLEEIVSPIHTQASVAIQKKSNHRTNVL
uniref:Uncharacterized protein n=1 Tax=Glossina brevipalpis TaxID=37001 RepID=A0A1A9WXL6_9MUSC